MKDTFAERLARLRAEKGMTQRELGAAAGVAWSMISKYESGQSVPRLKVLMRLAEALGTTTEELEGEDSVVLPIPSEIFETIRKAAEFAGMDVQEFANFYISRLIHRSYDEALGVKPALLWSEDEILSMQKRMKPGEREAKAAIRIKELQDLPADHPENSPVILAAVNKQVDGGWGPVAKPKPRRKTRARRSE